MLQRRLSQHRVAGGSLRESAEYPSATAPRPTPRRGREQQRHRGTSTFGSHHPGNRALRERHQRDQRERPHRKHGTLDRQRLYAPDQHRLLQRHHRLHRAPKLHRPGSNGFIGTRGSGAGAASMQYWLVSYNANCPTGQGWNQIPLYGGLLAGRTAPTPCRCPASRSPTWPTGPSTAPPLRPATASPCRRGLPPSTRPAATTPSRPRPPGPSPSSTSSATAATARGGGTASFNAGASANTRIEIIYGGTTAPNCVAQGFTAEKNNLSFGPTAPTATAPGPAVIFQESIAGGATSNCAAASTIGDTHLRTFNGLFYDFQAAGDFTLAEVDPGFSVQTRQVSGTPTWPNATVNKAVAARFGNDQCRDLPGVAGDTRPGSGNPRRRQAHACR